MISDTITIFTDGASRGNPGPGGFGAIVIKDGQVSELGGREEHTTNNRMEVVAVIAALSAIPNPSTYSGQVSQFPIKICSDSVYVIKGITRWVHGWRKNGWKTATKKAVENQDLWKKLFVLVSGRNIKWKQVSGHVGVSGNERCDEIATGFADGIKPKLYDGPLEKYPIKNILDVEQGEYNPPKFSGRKFSRARAYSYVSCVDGKVLVHKTWDECEARVKGKSGAKYKKALSSEDESKIIAFMRSQ